LGDLVHYCPSNFVRSPPRLKIWKYPQFGLVISLLFFGWFDFEIMTLYITLFLQNVRGTSPLTTTLYFVPDVISGVLTSLAMSLIIPRCRIQCLFIAGLFFLLTGPFLFVFSPAQQSYWPQTFPGIMFSAIGGMTLFNVANVFVATALKKEDQSLGQGIFNTTVQIVTAISLAIASTVADASGVHPGASKEELLHAYRACFWLCIGALAIPFVLVGFLKGGRDATQPEPESRNEKK
jgi:Major Facilitator Superfamily